MRYSGGSLRCSCFLGLVLVLPKCDALMGLDRAEKDRVPGETEYDSPVDSEGNETGWGGSDESSWIAPAPTSGQLPTVVNLDWSKFPKDPGPSYATSGRVWNVRTTGRSGADGSASNPLGSIREAGARARSGDLIRVYGGTYEESDGVDLSQDDVVLTAAAGEHVTLALPNRGTGIRVTARSGVVINGINIAGCTACIVVGLEHATQRNVVISNLRIDAGDGDFSDGIAAYADTRGLNIPTIEGLLIKNVQIYAASLSITCGNGICSSWRLENVKVKGSGADADGWGADGIAVEQGDNILLHGVEVSSVSSDGIDMKATRVVVWGCNVHHVKNNGIKLWHGGDVVNTVVHDLGDEPAIVAEGEDNGGGRLRLLHTTIANQPGGYGVAIGYDSQPRMQVEIIDSIYTRTFGAAYIDGNSTLSIKNSIFYGTTNGELVEWGSHSASAREGAAGLNRFGTGNLVVDPQLASSYHLRSGSPAIDKGIALSSSYPSTDGAGQTRVKGRGPDIGAFEDF